MPRNHKDWKDFWLKRMEKIDSLWLDDFTEEERNILSACIEKVKSIFHVGYVQSYKIITKYEEWKDIYLYRGRPDLDTARNVRLSKEDKSYTPFGRLFFEHYGISPTENPSLYSIENSYYKKYNVCSWLDPRCIIHNGRKHHLNDFALLVYQKFGILRFENPDVYDALQQHYRLYGNVDITKGGKFLNQVKSKTKSTEDTFQSDNK